MRSFAIPALSAFVALASCTSIQTIKAVPLSQGVMQTFTVAPSAAIDAARSALAVHKLEVSVDEKQGEAQVLIGE